MSGHSKWANIQHRKGAQDKKRGKVFTKLIREITIVARMYGGDVAANARLRLAVDKALSANMPKDTVERAIKRGVGDLEGANVEELTYEGYGPKGVAIIVECMTDNKNRTVAEVRHAFMKAGGNLGADGSVSYLFSELGHITFPPGSEEDKIMEIALELGAEDVVVNEDFSIDVMTLPASFAEIKQALENEGLNSVDAEVSKVASTQVTLNKDGAISVLKMVDALEDLDDVQEVYHNADISEEIYQMLAE